MEFIKNKHWDNEQKRVSIITPVFNRKEELARAIDSVFKQIYRDFEYIIVNDGSTIDIDGIVKKYMKECDIPMLYIKKENGGVHTARNLAIKYCRGEMIYPLDSDDEMLPNSLEILIEHWDSIPVEEKDQYREICARCCDQSGKEIGARFPNNINCYSLKKSHRLAHKSGGEHLGFWKTSIMKENPWPEVEGITLVSEGLLWEELEKKYKSYYINDIVRIYHQENDNSYVRQKKISLQSIKNKQFTYVNHLNNSPFRDVFIRVSYLCCFDAILRRNKYPFCGIKLTNIFHKILYCFLYLPGWFVSLIYEKKKVAK